MSKLKNFVTKIHQSTKRDYLQRMNDNKPYCMKKPESLVKTFGMERGDLVMAVILISKIIGSLWQ